MRSRTFSDQAHYLPQKDFAASLRNGKADKNLQNVIFARYAGGDTKNGEIFIDPLRRTPFDPTPTVRDAGSRRRLSLGRGTAQDHVARLKECYTSLLARFKAAFHRKLSGS